MITLYNNTRIIIRKFFILYILTNYADVEKSISRCLDSIHVFLLHFRWYFCNFFPVHYLIQFLILGHCDPTERTILNTPKTKPHSTWTRAVTRFPKHITKCPHSISYLKTFLFELQTVKIMRT